MKVKCKWCDWVGEDYQITHIDNEDDQLIPVCPVCESDTEEIINIIKTIIMEQFIAITGGLGALTRALHALNKGDDSTEREITLRLKCW